MNRMLSDLLSPEFGDEVAQMTKIIRRTYPQYGRIVYEEHAAAIHQLTVRLVEMIESGNGPTPLDMEMLASLGRERALQGIDIRSLTGAFHIGYSYLWSALSELIEDQAQLVTFGTRMWRVLEVLTSQLAASHAMALQVARTHRFVLSQQLFDSLGSPEGEAISLALMETLNFATGADFIAVGVSARAKSEVLGEKAESLIRRVESSSGVLAIKLGQGTALLLCQGLDEDQLTRLVREVFDPAFVAVGHPRRGIDGARESLSDVRLLLPLGRVSPGDGRTVATFRGHWLAALIHQNRSKLSAVLGEDLLAACRDNEHLIETALLFIESGGSINATARRQYLHPNSIKYRLQRWREVAELDMRTFDGQLRTTAAVWTSSEP